MEWDDTIIHTDFCEECPTDFVSLGMLRKPNNEYHLFGKYLYMGDGDRFPVLYPWLIAQYNCVSDALKAARADDVIVPCIEGQVIWRPIKLSGDAFAESLQEFINVNDWSVSTKANGDFTVDMMPESTPKRGMIVITNRRFILFPSKVKIQYDFIPYELAIIEINTSEGWNRGEFKTRWIWGRGYKNNTPFPEELQRLWGNIFNICTRK